MGVLLGRAAASELLLPAELQEELVSEEEAASSGKSRVLSCPRCQRRLLTLARGRVLGYGDDAPVVAWPVPSLRVEKAWLGGGSSVRCRACGYGRVPVEGIDRDTSSGSGGCSVSTCGTSKVPAPPRLVALRLSQRVGLRPFSVCVCGAYESAIERVAAFFLDGAVAAGRALHLNRRAIRRSDLAQLPEDTLPPGPLELVVVAHRISGQRNPLTDAHGLYSGLLALAWSRADAVVLCLLDLPPGGYLPQLLREQPTLLGLLGAGRLLPLFGASGEEDALRGAAAVPLAACAAPRAPEEGAPRDTGRRTAEAEEATWWLLRCLDGRIPRAEALGSSVASRGAGGPAALPFEAMAVEAAATGAAMGSATAILAPLAEAFEGWPMLVD